MKQQSIVSIAMLVCGLASLEVIASGSTDYAEQPSLKVSRYVTLTASASDTQKNPLSAVMPSLAFGQHVETVLDALQILLSGSGYRIANYHPDPRVHQLFNLSLPAVHRHMGPMSVEEGLNTLSGSPWMLTVDPVNRLVTYQLPKHYKTPRVLTQPQLSSVNYTRSFQKVTQLKQPEFQQEPAIRQFKITKSKKPISKKQQVRNYKSGLKHYLDQAAKTTHQAPVFTSDDQLIFEIVAKELQ